MITKLLGLGTIGFCVFTYIIGQLDPNNILVYTFLAHNPVNLIIKLAVAAGLLLTIFKGTPKSFWPQVSLRIISFGLILFSAAALVSPRLWGLSYAYLKPLDLLFLTEAGIVLAIVSLQARIKRPEWQLHHVVMSVWEARPRVVVSAVMNALREEQPNTAQ